MKEKRVKNSALLYIRVSTDEQAERGNSLKHQKATLLKYCMNHEIEVAQLYSEDYSAKSFNRPAFNELLSYAKKHKNDIAFVFISRWDRFSRNTSEAYQMLFTFQKLGISVQAVEQPLDLSIPENKLMLAFYLASPQVENERRSLNTRNGMRRAMKDGRYVGLAPIGYSNKRDEQLKPIIVPNDKAHLIKMCFNKYATGLYKREELRRIMCLKGLKVSKSRFTFLLSNPLYKGYLRVPAFQEEEEKIVLGLHKPIVDEKLFDRVQAVLESHKRQKSHTKCYESSNEDLPFRGLLVCRRCQKKLTGSKSRGKKGVLYPYYHCRNRCKERIPAKHAHEAVLKLLKTVRLAPEIAELYLCIMEDVFDKQQQNGKNELGNLKKKLAETKNMLDRLEEKFILDLIEQDSYLRMKPKLKQQVQTLEEQIDGIENQSSEFMEYLKFGMNLFENIEFYYENASADLKRKLVSSIFPENLQYEENKCRTLGDNSIILLLQGLKGNFGDKNKNPFQINSEKGCQVHRTGIEPVLPG